MGDNLILVQKGQRHEFDIDLFVLVSEMTTPSLQTQCSTDRDVLLSKTFGKLLRLNGNQYDENDFQQSQKSYLQKHFYELFIP